MSRRKSTIKRCNIKGKVHDVIHYVKRQDMLCCTALDIKTSSNIPYPCTNEVPSVLWSIHIRETHKTLCIFHGLYISSSFLIYVAPACQMPSNCALDSASLNSERTLFIKSLVGIVKIDKEVKIWQARCEQRCPRCA